MANGLMFAGAYLGQALGGAGVLFLIPYTGLPATFVFVTAVILAVSVFVALPMREPKGPKREPRQSPALVAVAQEIRVFCRDSYRAFTGTRAAWVGVIFALLPGGAYALSLALQSNLAVELGLSDHQIGQLALATTVISALFCVVGGWLSDHFGRRRMLALYFVGTAIPGIGLAWMMAKQGWVMPIDLQMADRPIPAASLVSAFWIACLVFAMFQGLMYGTRAALFMDITTPAVAATQFTAYMAMSNFVISYSATWQGLSIVRFGYPATLLADAAFGLVCIGLLPFMVVKPAAQE